MFPLLFSSRKGEEKAEAKKMWNEQRFFVEMLESMRILSYDQCSSIDDASYFSARRGRRDSRRGWVLFVTKWQHFKVTKSKNMLFSLEMEKFWRKWCTADRFEDAQCICIANESTCHRRRLFGTLFGGIALKREILKACNKWNTFLQLLIKKRKHSLTSEIVGKWSIKQLMSLEAGSGKLKVSASKLNRWGRCSLAVLPFTQHHLMLMIN